MSFQLSDKFSLPSVWSDIEKGYIAGIIDGEGCIGIYKRRNRGYFIQLTITNTHKTTMKWLSAKLHANALRHLSDQRPRNKQIFSITVDRIRAAKILEIVKPYLKIKQAQADLALNFKQWQDGQKLNGPNGHRKYDKLDNAIADGFVTTSHILNKKGNN